MTTGSVDQYGETHVRHHPSPAVLPADGTASPLLHSARPPESMAQLVMRRFRRHRLAVVALGILLAIAIISFGVPLFVSEDAANRLTLAEKSQPPSWQHPFGTDEVGRDIFLRSIFGGRISLRIGFVAALISVGIGMAIGALAGYNRGWIDSVLMRFTDALLSIPSLFILIVITQIVGKSIAIITVVIGALSWMTVSRIVRASVLSLKEQDFVLAARGLGAQPSALLARHILPNALAPVIVLATLGVGQAIIMEASLSFLGLGVQQPTATWGNMLFRAQSYLVTAPWIAFFPGVLILITVLCVNFIGDGLRDALDPHAQR
ncbi:MAG: ABC transporter permease [Thermomicrobiales bacterium]